MARRQIKYGTPEIVLALELLYERYLRFRISNEFDNFLLKPKYK